MKFLATLAVLFTAEAGAISRVGNSSIADPLTGFVAPFPMGFLDSRRQADGSLYEIQTPPRFVPTGAKTFKVQLRRFENEFPELKESAPEDIRRTFLSETSRLWWELRTADDCILGFASDFGVFYQVVLTWGQGRGLVLVGEKDSDILRGMREIVGGLRLEDTACTWGESR